jgi:hypothetical protein
MYLNAPHPDAGIQEELERVFFAAIRLKNGTYKFTYSRRMDDLNALVNTHLPAERPLRVMDVAVSSGMSTAEWADSMNAAGITHTMLAGDLTAHAFLISATPNLHVLVDRSGYPLQYDIFGAAVPNPPGKRNLLKYGPWIWLLDAANRLGLAPDAALASKPDGCVRFGVRCRPVMFTSPRLHTRSTMRVIDDDILEPWQRAEQFHVLRAANILNLDYFGAEVLTKMMANLRARLLPGGLFVVCRTSDEGVNHATMFRLNDDRRFTMVARLHGGADVEDLVLALR